MLHPGKKLTHPFFSEFLRKEKCCEVWCTIVDKSIFDEIEQNNLLIFIDVCSYSRFTRWNKSNLNLPDSVSKWTHFTSIYIRHKVNFFPICDPNELLELWYEPQVVRVIQNKNEYTTIWNKVLRAEPRSLNTWSACLCCNPNGLTQL